MKVLCINSDGWEEEGTREKNSGPIFQEEYTVIDDSEPGFYELREFPGRLFDVNEFVPAEQLSAAEEMVLTKVFSR